jgi:hypothetical protein
MIVIFDTNIWLSELGLNSSIGAAVRFYLKKSGVQVALPEVIELEAQHQFINKLTEYVAEIRDNYNRLLSLFGSLKEIVLPSIENIKEKVNHLFDGLSVEIVRIPFSLASARQSLIKTIDGVPPSGPKNQQFKDGVLWADCLDLLESDDVCIVTNDKAFYENRNYAEGLSLSLKKETVAKPHRIVLFHELAQLLSDIQTHVDIDKVELAKSYIESNGKSINNLITANGFEMGNFIDAKIQPFITENPELLSIEFSIEYSCRNSADETSLPAQLVVKGYGTYSITNRTFTNLNENEAELIFTTAEGLLQKKRSITLHVESIVLGHKDKTHIIRLPVV